MANLQKVNEKGWQLPKFEVHEFYPKKNKYCVCIPIINENGRILKQLDQMTKFAKKSVDIIIADGDSTDGSTNPKILKKKGVRTLLIKKSYGQQGTQLRMGLAYAIKEGYEGIVQIDGNNKDGVNAIPQFLKELDKGLDYIQGSRFVKGGKGINTPISRWIGIRLIASPIISLFSGHWYTDIPNGFRGYSRQYIMHPELKPFRDVFIKYELILYLAVRAKQLGLKTKEIPVIRKYPKGEVPSKISPIIGNWNYLITTLKAAIGMYNPK